MIEGQIRFCDTLLVSGDHVFTNAGEIHQLLVIESTILLVGSEREGVKII